MAANIPAGNSPETRTGLPWDCARIPAPHHPLSVRPAGFAFTARGAPEACASHANFDRVVRLADRARAPFPELAARSLWQLPGATGLHRARHPHRRHCGSGRRSHRHQSVRFLPRGVGRKAPVALRSRLAPGASPIPRRPAGGNATGESDRELSHALRARRTPHHGRPGGHQPAHPAPTQIRHPHGARRVLARGDADPWARLVPRFCLVAMPSAAAPRLCHAVRLRLFYSAQARRETGARARGRSGRRGRSARLDRGFLAWRGLDWARRHQRTHGGRGAYSAGLHTRSRLGRARHRLVLVAETERRRQDEGIAFLHHVGCAGGRGPAQHQALQRRDLVQDRGGRPRRGPRARRPGRALVHGRRANLRFQLRARRARVEHRRGRWLEVPPGRHSGAPFALPIRARGCASPRTRQVVSRRAAASLVHRLLLSDRWSPHLGQRRSANARKRRTRGGGHPRGRGFHR